MTRTLTGAAALMLYAGSAFACTTGARLDASCYPGALQRAADAAVAQHKPLWLPAGTYRLAAPLTIDYAAEADIGMQVISDGAVIDATEVHGRPAMIVECSGGTPASPTGCFYFHLRGTLFVNADTNGPAVEIGKPDLSDAQNSLKIDHLVVNNRSGGNAATGALLSYVLQADMDIIADTAGGGAGIEATQLQFSRLAGAGSAGTGAGIKLAGGYSFSNTFSALDLEVSPICITITSPSAQHNTFVSPYLDCPTALHATAGTSNLLFNANYAGATRHHGDATGIVSFP